MRPGSKRARARQAGASLIELLIAVVILGVLAYGVVRFIGNTREQSARQGAHEELKGEMTSFSALLLKTFRTRANDPVVNASGLVISRRARDNLHVQFNTTYSTVCKALPSGHDLSAHEQNRIANLSPCLVCPVGQRPVIVSTAHETGTTFQFPAETVGVGTTQKPIAGAICPAMVDSTLSVRVFFANISPARLVVPLAHEVHLTKENATSSGVTILR